VRRGILRANWHHCAATQYLVLCAPQHPRVLLDVLLPHVYSCSRAEHLALEAIGIVQTYLIRSPCHHLIGRSCRGVIPTLPEAHSPWPLHEATSKAEGWIVSAKVWQDGLGRTHMWIRKILITLGTVNGGFGIRLTSISPFQDGSNDQKRISGMVF
jgi:hypothetical protein